MAQQKGLFTGGTSVEELLAQRRERSNALRTSLAANAAQGARNAPRAQTASMMGSIVADLIGRKMGGEDPQMEKLKAANAQQESLQQQYGQELISGTPESNIKIGGELIKMGYGEYGGKLLQKGQAGMVTKQEKLREQQRRESLIEVAGGMGLTTQVELLQGGGDVEEAAKFIRNQREIQIAQDSGKQGQMSLASAYNKGPAFMKKVANGDFKSMDGVEYTALLKGKKADLVSFVNEAGEKKLFSVDETGMVFDTEKSLWVKPSELGLNSVEDGAGEKFETTFKQEQGLRQELAKDLNFNNYKESQLQFSKIKTSAKADSAAGDMSLIFAYMKMLDPDSVVREGEQATAENARGVTEGIMNVYNKAVTGKKMTVSQRADFVKTSRDLFRDIKKLAQPSISKIKEIAKKYELDEEAVFGKLTEKDKLVIQFETYDRTDVAAMRKAVDKLSDSQKEVIAEMIANGEL